MKCADILALLNYTRDRDHFSNDTERADYILLTQPFQQYMSSLIRLFENIPDILNEISRAPVICNSGSSIVEKCNKCRQGSMMRLLHRHIHNIMGLVIDCDEAQAQVDNARGTSPEDRRPDAHSRHGSLAIFPDLIFSMAETSVDTMFELFTDRETFTFVVPSAYSISLRLNSFK